MELLVRLGKGALHGHLRTELHMRSDGLAKCLIVGHASGIKGCHLQLDEPLTLFLGDLQVPVVIDEMRESSQLAGEAIRPTERFACKRGQAIDMLGLASAVERLKERVNENAAVESVLKTMERFLASPPSWGLVRGRLRWACPRCASLRSGAVSIIGMGHRDAGYCQCISQARDGVRLKSPWSVPDNEHPSRTREDECGTECSQQRSSACESRIS
jgi:hypothetical protein